MECDQKVNGCKRLLGRPHTPELELVIEKEEVSISRSVYESSKPALSEVFVELESSWEGEKLIQ
jgi:hypothetical protein